MVTKVLNYFSEIYSKLVYYWIILLYNHFSRKEKLKKLYHGWKAEYFILLFCAYVIMNIIHYFYCCYNCISYINTG